MEGGSQAGSKLKRRRHHEWNRKTDQCLFCGKPELRKDNLVQCIYRCKIKSGKLAGVTVERVEGETSYKGRKIHVIDTPGIYSLTSYTMEELVTRRCIEEDDVDVIINVVDASSLERNLYLTLQLLELKKPVILALNMMDIIEERGMEIDLHRLPEMLGLDPGRSGISEKEDRTRCSDACSGTSL